MSLKIVFDLGFGRSGTTFFDSYLARQYDYFYSGETITALKTADKVCSCGKTLKECEFWSSYFLKYRTKAELAALKGISRFFSFPLQLGGILFYDKKIVSHLYKEFYHYIGEHTEKKGIVDSSKLPALALMMMKDNPHVQVEHLVRNLSGVVNSYFKDYQKGMEFRIFGMNLRPFWMRTVVIAIQWSYYNSISGLLGLLYPKRYRLVRYEDLLGYV